MGGIYPQSHAMSRVLVAVLASACATSQKLPPPPDYQPASAPEPATSCPNEAARARAAREAQVGSSDPQLAERAAEAILLLGDCERLVFDGIDISIDAGAARPQF